MENIGKAWIILEGGENKELIAILNPRKSSQFMLSYVEQLYVNRHASFEEKVRYKKRKSSWPYMAKTDGIYNGNIFCGKDPYMSALLCHKLNYSNGELAYTFKKLSKAKGSIEVKSKVVTGHVKVT